MEIENKTKQNKTPPLPIPGLMAQIPSPHSRPASAPPLLLLSGPNQRTRPTLLPSPMTSSSGAPFPLFSPFADTPGPRASVTFFFPSSPLRSQAGDELHGHRIPILPGFGVWRSKPPYKGSKTPPRPPICVRARFNRPSRNSSRVSDLAGTCPLLHRKPSLCVLSAREKYLCELASPASTSPCSRFSVWCSESRNRCLR